MAHRLKASNLSQSSVFNVSPNDNTGGIWMSGRRSRLRFIQQPLRRHRQWRNSTSPTLSPPTNDYGDSFLKLCPVSPSQTYFTPSDELTDEDDDRDFGSGGATLFDLPANGGNPTHLAIAGGKDATFICLTVTTPAGLGNSNAWQNFTVHGAYFATARFLE